MFDRGLQLGNVTFREHRRPGRPERGHSAPMVFHADRPVAPMFRVVLDPPSAEARRPAGPLVSVVTHLSVVALALFVLPLTGVAVLPDVPEHVQYVRALVQPAAPLPLPPPAAAAEPQPAPPAEVPDEAEVAGPASSGPASDEPLSSKAPPRAVLIGAPVMAGRGIRPESGLVPGRPPSVGGVPGGVGWGVSGGVVGGVPPPPPPPPPEVQPVRVGGPIPTPELLHRVEPDYPMAAQLAKQQGLVILDAIVDEQGAVSEVSVMRSAGKLLDRAALDAVRQWRYTPLLFHGTPTPFRLTVTVSFSVSS